MTTTPDLPPGFDLTDPEIYASRVPHEEFAELRRTAPVYWIDQVPEAHAGFPAGYWAITRHADVLDISKDSANWSTYENGAIIRFAATMTREEVELTRAMVINHDPPDHTRLRTIISRGFTPRSVAQMRDSLQQRATNVLNEAREKGSGDFVTDVAAELPLQVIADLMGVPQEDRLKIFDWSNQMMIFDDPEFGQDPAVASAELLAYFSALADDRKANPRDDIMTKLVTAGEDDEGLSSDQLGYFVIMLAVAGNETTRNAITHGMNAFLDNPDQWELFKKERPRTAVDEIIRWATPVTVFQRTATRDTEVGGVPIKKGERVGLFYAAANHDTSVFEDPETFNILRDPNPHVAFGGHGAHYCVGANLARMEVEIMFNVIADRMPDIRKLKEPRRLRSGWINGIKELQVAYA